MIIRNPNKILLSLLGIGIFFIGCSNKSVSIPVVVKPNYISIEKTKKIRKIKISDFKNDRIGLKNKVVEEMNYINTIVPDYFIINPINYKSVIIGNVKINVENNFYRKSLKIEQKGPICQVALYKCTSFTGNIMCQSNPEKLISLKSFKSILKNAYIKRNYIYYNKRLYKIIKKCKPTSVSVKCNVKDFYVRANIAILDRNNNILFNKSYIETERKDPCKNIDYYEGTKEYIVNNDNYILSKISNRIAKNIVYDIAPHINYINMELIDDIDISDISSKDKKIFESALDKDNKVDLYEKLRILKTLRRKYPNSCVIEYDLGVFEMLNKNYNKAKMIFNDLLSKNCKNKTILSESNKALTYLKKLY